MIINHNLNAMNAHRNMGINNTQSGKAMEKLSSGLRINRAGDDAAGLAISEKMRGQIRGLDQAARNSQDGISLIQTGEGALQETHSILQRMRELAVQSANDTNVGADRSAIQKEMDQLAKEITRIADQTEFNTKNLLGDGAGTEIKLHVGANKNQTIGLTISKMDAATLGVVNADARSAVATVAGVLSVAAATAVIAGTGATAITTTPEVVGVTAVTAVTGVEAVAAGAGGIFIDSQTAAEDAIATINSAITTVSSERANLGAMQNRLEHTISNLNNTSENLQAAESRIRDVDMAKEMMNFSKNNILNQAAQAMLAQANQQPQAVLQLLR